MLATYMRRMRNNNLEISIVGSSCRPQQFTILKVRGLKRPCVFNFDKILLLAVSHLLLRFP